LLLSSEQIEEAVVVRMADAKWGEVPVAFVVPRHGALSIEQVLDLCRGRIASYKIPKTVVFVRADELPRSTAGKIKRHELERRPDVGSREAGHDAGGQQSKDGGNNAHP